MHRGLNVSDTVNLTARWLQPVQRGRVIEAVGTLIKATGISVRLGELCRLSDVKTGFETLAEVAGFSGGNVWLSPMGSVEGLSPSTQVEGTGQVHSVAVGDFLLGRVVNGLGTAFLDQGPGMPGDSAVTKVWSEAPAPLKRPSIQHPLPLGVRAIDGLLTVGRGQRMGVFAPAGCGKSTLLSMLCRNADVDVTIVALVGERGREVGDFLDEGLDEQSRKQSILVVSTSDRPATERLKAAFVATAYAEHFRRQGKSVLLLIDSVTRLARAAREIGLAAGEPPTRRGFPPSVFALLPKLFERAGLSEQGDMTAFYTILEETSDGNDPIAEEVRSLLDGGIVLSRELAQKGHFPAIDVLSSLSRLMPKLIDDTQLSMAQRSRELLSKYNDVELLVRIGEYRKGVDALADQAIDKHDALERFVRQRSEEKCSREQTISLLQEVLA